MKQIERQLKTIIKTAERLIGNVQKLKTLASPRKAPKRKAKSKAKK